MTGQTITSVLASAITPSQEHCDSWLSLDQTAQERRFSMPYKKTYNFNSDYIDGYHKWLASAPRYDHGMLDLGIEGWLLPADALKLYEMAYFADDILELGTYKGLSGTIMSNAIFNSGRTSPVVTVDLDPECSADAQETLRSRDVPGRENVYFFVFDAVQFVRNLADQGRMFTFAFVDHSHIFEHVKDTCVNLHKVIAPGGFCLFHDFNDPRNADVTNTDYGVYQGVTDGLSQAHFDFNGIFGCTSLWRRNSTPI